MYCRLGSDIADAESDQHHDCLPIYSEWNFFKTINKMNWTPFKFKNGTVQKPVEESTCGK